MEIDTLTYCLEKLINVVTKVLWALKWKEITQIWILLLMKFCLSWMFLDVIMIFRNLCIFRLLFKSLWYLNLFLGNTLAPTGQQYDNKTGQWFGSLVRSSGEDGVVLVSSYNISIKCVKIILKWIYLNVKNIIHSETKNNFFEA